MTEQEQFKADYLLAKNEFGNEIDHYIPSEVLAKTSYRIWLKQAARHKAEIAELVNALKSVQSDVDTDVIRVRPSDREAFLQTLELVGSTIAKYEAKP